MKPAQLDAAVVSALAARSGEAVDSATLRREIGCSAAELRESVQRLRWKGKLEYDRIALVETLVRRLVAPEPDAPAEIAVTPPPCVDQPAPLSLDQQYGAELLELIERWCAQHQVGLSSFGRMACPNPFAGFVGLLRKRGWVSPEMYLHVKAWMTLHPNGCTLAEAAQERSARQASHAASTHARSIEAAPGVAGEVRAEADAAAARRRSARSTGTVVNAIGVDRRTPAELIQSMMLEDPGDVIAMLKRRYSDLWCGVVAGARAAGATPAAHLVEAIAAGLLALSEERAEALRKHG